MAYKSITVRCAVVVQHEALANEAITPGHIVQMLSTGKIQKNDLVGERVPVRVAIEDSNQGNDKDDNWASGSQVQYRFFRPGDEVLVRLANGQSVAIGDRLEAAAGGEVRKSTTGSSGGSDSTDAILEAQAALDFSGSSGVDPASNLLLAVVI